MPRLPNAHLSVVDERKITAYLLCDTHREGAAKARFFKRFGFRLADWQRMHDALLAHAAVTDVDDMFEIEYGRMYELVGPLVTPDSRNPTVRTAWMIRRGEDFPRFVTAIPA